MLVHLHGWSPPFAALPEKRRATALFLMLDHALGEDDVERWLGGIHPVAELPQGAVGWDGLHAAIDGLRSGPPRGQASVLRIRRPGESERIASVDFGAKRIEHLGFDTSYVVTLPFAAPRADGMPLADENAELYAIEDALLEVLGPDALWLGRESGGGARVVFVQAAAAGPVASRLERWRHGLGRSVTIEVRYDPQWHVQRRW